MNVYRMSIRSDVFIVLIGERYYWYQMPDKTVFRVKRGTGQSFEDGLVESYCQWIRMELGIRLNPRTIQVQYVRS